MEEKKRFRDIFNLNFFVLLFPVAALEIYLLILLIRDFSILHIGWFLMCTVLLILDIFWMQARFFEDRDALNKEIRAWDQRRKQAKKNGISFTEPKPKRKKILTPPGAAVFGVVLAVVLYGSIVLALFNIAIPRGPGKYVKNIAELKKDRPDVYYFFPDRIPGNSSGMKWKVQPSIMQGQGYEVLYFYTDSGYIVNELETYCKDIEPKTYDDMPVGVLYDELEDAELEHVEWYEIYNNGDQNHEHAWGIFVEPELNLIGYFAQ